MSLLDLPKPRITAQSRPGNRQMADARIKAAEAKLLNAKARHQRAAAALEAAKARARKALASAQQQERAERMAWDRVANIMGEYERVRKLCGDTNG